MAALATAGCAACAGRVWILRSQIEPRRCGNQGRGLHALPRRPQLSRSRATAAAVSSSAPGSIPSRRPSRPHRRPASSSCRAGGPGGGQASESQKLAMLKLSRCMRAHGVTSFPDPTNKQPSPGNGPGLAFGAARLIYLGSAESDAVARVQAGGGDVPLPRVRGVAASRKGRRPGDGPPRLSRGFALGLL